MNRIIKTSLILCLTVLMLLLASCGKTETVKTAEPSSASSDDAIIINVTDEGNAIIDKALANGGNSIFQKENFEKTTRQAIMNAVPQAFPDVEVKYPIEKESIDGSDYYVMSNGDYDNIIYYIHGGAWVYGMDKNHVTFCEKLVDRLNAKVYMPLYPLAPQSTYQEAYTMIVDLYEEIIKEGKPIFLMGDSAGGNIALGLLYLIKDGNMQMPDKVVLLHPAADMTLTNPDMAAVEPSDPELAIYGCQECAKMWAGDSDLSAPIHSAVNADVSGYPPTLMFLGTRDILSCDDLVLYDKMKSSGVDVTLVKGIGLFHVFEVCDIPEGEESTKLVTEFCSK